MYILFSREFMVVVALFPFSYSLANTLFFSIMFLFFLSLVDIGPIEKCLTELKTPNILPAEREDIKSQVRNAMIDSSEEFLNFFSTFFVIMTYYKNRGLVQFIASFSAALGCLRAPTDLRVGGIHNSILKSYHCFAAWKVCF